MRTLIFRNKQINKIQMIFYSFHAFDSTCLTMQWSLLYVSLKYIRRSFEFNWALGFLSSHKALREKHISIICLRIIYLKLVHDKSFRDGERLVGFWYINKTNHSASYQCRLYHLKSVFILISFHFHRIPMRSVGLIWSSPLYSYINWDSRR